MIPTLPPDVRATPVRDVSPTMAEALRQCGLRVSFRMDHRYAGMARLSLPAAIGIATHRLAQMVTGGRFDELPSADVVEHLGSAWDALLSELSEQIQQRSPLGEVPVVNRWPGYQLVRTRLLARFASDVEAGRERLEQRTREVRSEEKLSVPGEGLAGTPDRVEIGPTGVEIIDLKTGWSVGDALSPAHRRQLLFYAYLWYRVHDEWPVGGSVQRLDGHRVRMEITTKEAQAEIDRCKALVETYNRSISRESPVALAAPSPDTCRFCDYKGACWAFFAAATGQQVPRRVNFLGELSAVSHKDNARSVELVDVRGDPAKSSGTTMRILGLPGASGDLAAGQMISVTDAHPLRSGDARADWETRLWGWTGRDT